MRRIRNLHLILVLAVVLAVSAGALVVSPQPVRAQAGPDLTITKTAGGTFTVGTQGIYTITVTNIGNAATSATTTVTDNLPSGLTFASGTGTGWTCGAAGQLVTCTFPGAIPVPNGTTTITLVVNVGLAAVPTVTNIARVSTPGDINNTNDIAQADTPVQGTPDLTITMFHTTVFRVGQQGTYTIRIQNVGSAPTTGAISVAFTLPASGQMSYASGTGGTSPAWSCPGGGGLSATCTFSGSVPAFGFTPDLLITVNNNNPGTGLNTTATVSTPGDVNGTNNTATDPTDVLGAPDLIITKSDGGLNFTVNNNEVYTLTVTNQGSGDTYNSVTVTDVLPSQLTFVSGTGTGWNPCTAAGQTVTCVRNTPLAAGANSTITLTVKPVATGTNVLNTATVASVGDINAGNNSGSDTTTIVAVDLRITKTHTGTFNIGVPGTFTVEVENIGSGPTMGTITVVDTLPVGMDWNGATVPAGWTCPAATPLISGPSTVTCTFAGPINPGAANKQVLTFSMIARTTGTLVNNVSVSTPNDADATNNTASDSVSIVGPDITITKSIVAGGNWYPGGTGTYELVVSNLGPGNSAAQIDVADTLPAGMTVTGFTFTGSSAPPFTCSGTGTGTASCQLTAQLIPGAGNEKKIQIAVSLGISMAPGTVTNTATVSGGADTNPANNSASVPTPIGTAPVPDMTITKTGVAFVVGQPGTFTITVTNSGTAGTVSGVTVTDTIPAAFTIGGATGTGWAPCGAAGQVVTCTFAGVLAPGNTASFDITVTPTAAGSGTNTATITAGGGETNTTNNTATFNYNITPGPVIDLSITKTHTGNFVMGTPGSYTLSVQNISSVNSLPGITVTDTLPTGLTYNSTTTCPAGWTCPAGPVTGPGTVTFTKATAIAAGATENIVISVTASSTGTLNNQANLSGGGDTNATNNNSTDPTIVTAAAAPDLAVTKSHSGNFTVGVNGTFTVTVTNVGSGPTTGPITVTDTLPGGMTLVAGSSGGPGFTCTGTTTATCTSAGPIAAGVPVAITLVVNPPSAGTFPANSATVATTGDVNPANDTGTDPQPTVVGGVPDLAISGPASANFLLSAGTGTYSLTINNLGTSPTTGAITLNMTLPAALVSYASNTGGFTCSGTTTVTCSTPGPIAGGGILNFNVVVNLTAVGGPTNATFTVGGGGDTNTANNTATVPTTVQAAPSPDLSLAKSGPASMTVGTNANYTLTVTNNGTGPTTSTITVTDTLPAGLSFVSGSGGGFSCTAAGQTVTCTSAGPIAAGAPVVITLTVNPTAAGSVTNTATVNTVGDTNAGNNTGSFGPTTIGGVADLSISKTHAPITFTVGTPATYTITVANVGGAATTGAITVTDNLPAGLSLTGASGAGWSCGGAPTVTCTSAGPINAGGNSVITLSVNPTVAGSVTNTASVTGGGDTNAANNTASDPTTINAPIPGAISATLSTASVTPASIPADNATMATLTVTLLTNSGAPAAGATVVVTSALGGLTITQTSGNPTGSNGVATFTIKGTTGGTATLTITGINGFGSVQLTQQPTLTLTGGIGTGTTSGTNSTLICDFLSIPADGRATATCTVTLRDGSNNPVPNKNVVLTASPTLAGVTLAPVASTLSDAAGQVRFTVKSTVQGSITLQASDTSSSPVVFIAQTAQLGFTAPGTAPVANPAAAVAAGTGGAVPVPSGPTIGVVRAFLLRVRTGPGLEFPIIGLLRQQTQVLILAKNSRGTWYQIKLDTGTAWVSALWVRVTRAAFNGLPVVNMPGTAPLQPIPPPLIPRTGEGVGSVTAFRLRVRSGPGTNYRQIGSLQLRTQVLLIGRSVDRGWFQIRIQGGTAWVSARWIRVLRINGVVLPTVPAPPAN